MKSSKTGKQRFWSRFEKRVQNRFEEHILPVELLKSKEMALKLCTKLNAWGVNATTAPEEGQSAIIKIAGSPIHWVRVEYGISFFTDLPNYYYVSLVIPDSRPLPQIEVVAKPTRGWRGILNDVERLRPTYVRWEGKDADLGLIRDQKLESAILKAKDYTKIKLRTYPYHHFNCWDISPDPVKCELPDVALKQERWRSYEDIATHLLAISIPQ